MKAFVRYVAINTPQPDAMAQHYKHCFDVHEVARSGGAISLSDGWFKITLLARWPDDEIAGVARYGLAVADLDALKSRLAARGRLQDLQPGVGGAHRGEWQLLDPAGMPWDLSACSFGMADTPVRAQGVPRIRHAEISVADPQQHMAWMEELLDIREIHTGRKLREGGSPEFPLRQVGDGQVNVTFLPFHRVPGRRMSERHRRQQWVVQHFGWVVPDLYATTYRVPPAWRSPWPAMGNMAESKVQDPDGNVMDLSETKGYEVAFDRWERGSGPGGPPAQIRLINA